MPGPYDSILDKFRAFRGTWPSRGWTYDDRFECVASTFDGDFSAEAKTLLAPVFPYVFTERALTGAGEPLRAVAERTGGIRSTQLLFGADPVRSITPYGLWWPWEEARTISIRIGLDGARSAELDALCSCFGIVRGG